jgi:Domain of Unknown Function (DUF1080)
MAFRLFLVISFLGFSAPNPPVRSLFDGKTFSGWDGDTATTWRIEAGALVGGSTNRFTKNNDFLCTKQEYSNFELVADVKLEGTGFVNAGIQFRSQRAKNPAYEMIGYQADMGGNFWGCLYDESRRNRVLAGSDSVKTRQIVKADGWNEYRIRCEGPRIRLYLNGQLTTDYTETDLTLPQKGLIGLQIHGGGKAQASYRNIKISEL